MSIRDKAKQGNKVIAYKGFVLYSPPRYAYWLIQDHEYLGKYPFLGDAKKAVDSLLALTPKVNRDDLIETKDESLK